MRMRRTLVVPIGLMCVCTFWPLRALASTAPQEEEASVPCWEEETTVTVSGGESTTINPCNPPSCSIALDCNHNGLDDRCDASCLNTGQFCSGSTAFYDSCTRSSLCGNDPDCNNNDRPDACDLTGNDCNNNGVPDECDADCNANGVPDDCDVSGGTSPDIDANGIPDECEDCDGDGIPDGIEDNPYDQDCDHDGTCNGDETPDCNNNGLPDSCETAPATSTFAFNSGILTPMDYLNDHEATFHDVPYPVSDVTLTFEAIGDLDSLDYPESVRVHIWPAVPGCGDTFLGYCTIGNVFNDPGEGSACPATPDTDTLPISAQLFIDLLEANNGDLQIWMDPGFNVDACVDSFISVRVSYTTTDDCDGNGVPDDCDPDCNGNGVPDACDLAAGTSPDCNANAVPDECDIDDGTSPDCNGNATPDECEDDCNGNGVPDDCDIDPSDPDGDTFVSQDCDGSALPDECEPSADSAGSRYIEITPGGFDFYDQYLDPATQYRIMIEPYPDGSNACNAVWVRYGGTLTDDIALADELTPDQWCTQWVRDAIVIPDGIYTVIADAVDPPGQSLMWNIQTAPYCDVNQSGVANVVDLSAVIDCFQGLFTETITPQSCDQAPAADPAGTCLPPDGYINVDDILAVIDYMFNGILYPCPDPCFTGPEAPLPAGAPATPGVLATAETPHTIDAGDYVEVDVYVSGSSDLRAYELSVDITGGSGGALNLVDAYIDETRTDYAFYGAGETTYPVVDLSGGRVANVLQTGSVDASTDVYAATFKFQATSSASGTFTATALIADAKLRNAAALPVGVGTTTSTTIVVNSDPQHLPVQK